MRPPNSISVAPNPTPATVNTVTIDTAAVDAPTTDAGHIDYPTSSSLAESPSPHSYPSLHGDDTPTTSQGDLPWSPAHLPHDHPDLGKELDAGSNSDEDQHHDHEVDVGMMEDGDNDDEMDHGDAVIPDVNDPVEIDMDVTSSQLQPFHYDDDQPFESDASTSPAPPAFLHPDLAPMGHPLGTNPGIALAFSGHTNTSIQLQQQLPYADHILNDEALNSNHPMVMSNANPMSLGPENPGVVDFLRQWIWQSQASMPRAISGIPLPSQVRDIALQIPRRVTYEGLKGDEYDFQGINWSALGISRSAARNRRLNMYCNYVNKKDSDIWLVSYEPYPAFL